MPDDKHKFICEEALEITQGPRAAHYGPPYVNFERIRQKWNGHLFGRLIDGGELTVEDVAAMMIDLKTARISEGYLRDSALDIAGYAQCMEYCCEPNSQLRYKEILESYQE